jgi:hypothetical protein
MNPFHFYVITQIQISRPSTLKYSNGTKESEDFRFFGLKTRKFEMITRKSSGKTIKGCREVFLT